MIALTIAALLAAFPAVETLLPGTYANEQQVVADARVPWTGVIISGSGADFSLQRVDAFGSWLTGPEAWRVTQTPTRVTIRIGRCRRDFARVAQGLTIINRARCNGTSGPTTFTNRGMAMDGPPPGMAPYELQRARAFICSVSAPRQDGSLWSAANLPIHDAGGRIQIITDKGQLPRFILRLHNDAFPLGTAKPAMTLTVSPDKLLASASTDPNATRIGLKLPAIEATCSLAG